MAPHVGAVAVAVSGGGDSVALMHLLAGFAKARKLPPPVVLTVDHGLRKSSAADARKVAAWAKALGLKAHVLAWRGKKPRTGIEAAAREARYALMGAWLVKHGIAGLHVAHTMDEQAETFLLRLARGSGLDGLAAMRAVAPWPVPGFESLIVHRPLLGIGRADLRAHLQSAGQTWLEDPMNDDDAFDRIKIRRAAAVLADAGLSSARIAAAAAHLSRARAALETVTEAVLVRAVRTVPLGDSEAVLLDPAAITAAPREVGLRALSAVLMAVSGQPYRPRFEGLERLFDRIGTGELGAGATLHGCHICPAPKVHRAGTAALLLVRRENPRKSGSSAKRSRSAG
jgi:tRNA(Ile)-lysidine synthase